LMTMEPTRKIAHGIMREADTQSILGRGWQITRTNPKKVSKPTIEKRRYWLHSRCARDRGAWALDIDDLSTTRGFFSG
jgi:hypothetical protein